MPPSAMQQFVNTPLPEPFLVRVLTVISGTPKTYTAEEWHSEGITSGLPGTTGPWIAKTGGRQITSNNPGYALPAAAGTETVLAVGDFAWAKSADGQAGLYFELVPVNSSGGYTTIQDEGTPLPKQHTLNFIGANVTVTDDPGSDRTNVTISGGVTSTFVRRAPASLQTFTFTANIQQDTGLEIRVSAGTYQVTQGISTNAQSTSTGAGVLKSDWALTQLFDVAAATFIPGSMLWGATSNSSDGVIDSVNATVSSTFVFITAVPTTLKLYVTWASIGTGTGQMLFYNGTVEPVWVEVLKLCCPPTVLTPLVWDTPGSHSATVPAGATQARTTCYGGGGGGCGTNSTAYAGGGGGGAFSLGAWRAVSAGSMLIGTVGAGGAGNTLGNGSAGGDTDANSGLVIAKGGGGGTSIAPGSGGTAGASTGVLKYSGGNGGVAATIGRGSGGGAAAGSLGAGGNGLDGTGVAGGAGGVAGVGGGGAGGAGAVNVATPVGGAAPGGGGGGAATSAGPGTPGGNGAAGKIVIEFA